MAAETRTKVFTLVSEAVVQANTLVVCITIESKRIWVYVPGVLPKIELAIENIFYKYYTESALPVCKLDRDVEVLNKEDKVFGGLVEIFEAIPPDQHQRWLVVVLSKESILNIIASGRYMMDEASRIAFCSTLLDFVTSHAFDTLHVNYQAHYEFLDDIMKHRVDVTTTAPTVPIGPSPRQHSSETIMIYGRKEK